mmetsp:Transcript_71017/g.197268  ORF Transcript_71017/g.197268 Transcript_71017/m.197268 type:complete len:382 (-) Transcript_71017:27-1172(-)
MADRSSLRTARLREGEADAENEPGQTGELARRSSGDASPSGSEPAPQSTSLCEPRVLQASAGPCRPVASRWAEHVLRCVLLSMARTSSQPSSAPLSPRRSSTSRPPPRSKLARNAMAKSSFRFDGDGVLLWYSEGQVLCPSSWERIQWLTSRCGECIPTWPPPPLTPLASFGYPAAPGLYSPPTSVCFAFIAPKAASRSSVRRSLATRPFSRNSLPCAPWSSPTPMARVPGHCAGGLSGSKYRSGALALVSGRSSFAAEPTLHPYVRGLSQSWSPALLGARSTSTSSSSSSSSRSSPSSSSAGRPNSAAESPCSRGGGLLGGGGVKCGKSTSESLAEWESMSHSPQPRSAAAIVGTDHGILNPAAILAPLSARANEGPIRP